MNPWYAVGGGIAEADAWLGVREAAAYAAVSVEVVVSSIARHELAAVRSTRWSLGSLMLHRRDVEAWAARLERARSKRAEAT